MIWFHKILKLILKAALLEIYVLNIKKKLSNLTAFLEIYLYLKNNNSVKHV